MSRRILVLSEPFGMGHERAAQALIKSLQMLDPGIATFHTNSIKSSYPVISNLFTKLYIQLIKKFPQIWHRFYQNGRRNRDNRTAKNLIHRLLAGTVKKHITEFQPHAVICTHPFPASVVSRLKQEGLSIPLIGIITDYDVHAFWLDKNIDLYITGDNSLNEGFSALDFNPRNVSGEGIPIDPVFQEGIDKGDAREKLGLDPQEPVILVAGGGWGLGNLDRIVELLLHIPEDHRIAVITGTNKETKKMLEQRFTGFDRVKIKGFVRNIHEYMAAADIMVTKPGGLTTSEGLAAGVPMVLFDVLYGQEEWNARFLMQNGAALKCGTVEEIPALVGRLLENPAEHRLLGEKALGLGKPDSAANAASRILNLCYT